MPQYDTIIIGAGMSGLAAGIRLAHFDRRVLILERHTTIGGLNSFYRQRGRNFDVGLHAVTNYAPKGAKRGPLVRLLRQLRLAWEDFSLLPQRGSQIAFPGVSLRFTNDFELFAAEVAREFPRQEGNLRRLVAMLVDYDADFGEAKASARQVVGELIDDPLLVEMIFCPLLFYGGSRERDMEFGQFSIMFRALFLEGFGRPLAGVRPILKKLVRKFKELGGELRLRAGVTRIASSGGKANKVVLDDGSELEARHILSSAGWRETMRLCTEVPPPPQEPAPGQLTFVESISVLDKEPRRLGHDKTIVFFNDSAEFAYEKPSGLVDVRSGVICSPNNFESDAALPDGLVRITALANYDRWAALDEEAYRLEKLRWYDRMAAAAVRFVPDFRGAVIDTDVFTPTTIERFTGKENGAVYGAPEKRYDGTTHLENLYLCGTDQGFVGIVGSIVSGITIANRYLLKA